MNDPVNYVDLWGLQAGILDLVDDLLPVIVVLGPVAVKVAVVVAAVVVVVVVADAIIDAVTNDDPPAEDEDIEQEGDLDPGAVEDPNVKADVGNLDDFVARLPPDLPPEQRAAIIAALTASLLSGIPTHPEPNPQENPQWNGPSGEKTMSAGPSAGKTD